MKRRPRRWLGVRTLERPGEDLDQPASEPVHSLAVWQHLSLLAGFLPLSLWLKLQGLQRAGRQASGLACELAAPGLVLFSVFCRCSLLFPPGPLQLGSNRDLSSRVGQWRPQPSKGALTFLSGRCVEASGPLGRLPSRDMGGRKQRRAMAGIF